MFSSNLKNYGFSYIEDSIKETPLTLPVSPPQNRVMKSNTFDRVIQSNMVLACFNCMKFCCSVEGDFNNFVLQTATKILRFIF